MTHSDKQQSSRRDWIGPSLLAWLAIGAFWLATTHKFHPSLPLAIIVTTALVSAYAAAAYINHLVLIPNLSRARRLAPYWFRLSAVMISLTAAALAVIRFAYARLYGPDPDPYGVYRHFLIDLFGMAVHLAGAAAIVGACEYAFHRAPALHPDHPERKRPNSDHQEPTPRNDQGQSAPTSGITLQ
jgi:hypothetical protein